MGNFIKFMGIAFLLFILLIAIFVVSEKRRYHWENGGGNPSWAAEQFYESRVELIFEDQPITLSNGAVVRATHGYSNDVYGNYRIRDYSPPLFHVLEDGKILVVVTTSPRILRSQQGTEAIYEWRNVSDERINIYILDNGDRPERIELWAMYPGEADSTNRMQLKTVQTRVVNEDKRIWAAETIPWFAFEEKVIQSVEEKWGYGYQEAQIQWRPEDDYELRAYSYQLEAAKFLCDRSWLYCEEGTGIQFNQEEYEQFLLIDVETGNVHLDKALNGQIPKYKEHNTSIYVAAELVDECGPYQAPQLKLSEQPFVALPAYRGREPQGKCFDATPENDYVNHSYSVGKYEFVHAHRGKHKCTIDCSSNHEFVLVAEVNTKWLSPSSFYRIARNNPVHFSQDYPVYLGK